MNRDDYYEMVSDAELTQAGRALRRARSNLAVATYDAKTLTDRAAADGGRSEVELARLLGVSRHTVRGWLGKPRQR